MSLPDEYSPVFISLLEDILFADSPIASSETHSSMPSLRSPSPDLSPLMADPLEPRGTLAGYQGIWPTFVGAATPWYSESVTVLGDLPTAVRYYPY